jgi:hypothetical protein
MDRGYQKWELWNAIVDKKSSYLCRVRDKISWEAIEPKTLTDADRQAGVLSDQIIRIARSGSRVDHPVRLVIIQGKPHVSRGRRHLLSTKQEGVGIQVYSAIIACMLILLYTGRTPTGRTFEMICLYMIGWASLEELEAHIEKLKSWCRRDPCARSAQSGFAAARNRRAKPTAPCSKSSCCRSAPAPHP